MKKSIIGVVVLALLIGLAAVYYMNDGRRKYPLGSFAEKAKRAGEQAGPVVGHPIPVPSDPVEEVVKKMEAEGEIVPNSLPSLSESDAAMKELLPTLFQLEELTGVGILNHFVQRFVVTVDNLTEAQVPNTHIPTNRPRGRFIVGSNSDGRRIAVGNEFRYLPFVRLIESMDVEKSVEAYIRFYPLFQKAYRELGYPNASFHYRLLEVIDHILATPELEEPPLLVRPAVLYQYADPELEKLSGGQKILLRIGVEYSEIVREKLEDIREELIDRTED